VLFNKMRPEFGGTASPAETKKAIVPQVAVEILRAIKAQGLT
jgi:hypothetical protein